MQCNHCGKNSPAGSKFCIYCGKPLTERVKICCPSCGTEIPDAEAVYCWECGAHLKNEGNMTVQKDPSLSASKNTGSAGATRGNTGISGTSTAAASSRVQTNRASAAYAGGAYEHTPLQEYKGWSFYKGAPAVGVAYAMGTVQVYSNRIVLKKQLGSAMGNLSLATLLAAKKKVQDDSVDTIWLNSIQSISVGRYGGVYNTVYIESSEHEPVSVVPMLPGSPAPQEFVDIVLRLLNK